ncbi:hypothetical protein BV22DRAFT_888388 [Leucogyrophana mollusca]|uniref:Uncharacterized protein n=1 Tax=Leucogyrophana mollusca TaxID=85980 RepID=A0ACB8B1D4_9AGAM|nr:hypothetical protein BV22DRAFT_888388 [Leucogyrophana mollusca]
MSGSEEMGDTGPKGISGALAGSGVPNANSRVRHWQTSCRLVTMQTHGLGLQVHVLQDAVSIPPVLDPNHVVLCSAYNSPSVTREHTDSGRVFQLEGPHHELSGHSIPHAHGTTVPQHGRKSLPIYQPGYADVYHI